MAETGHEGGKVQHKETRREEVARHHHDDLGEDAVKFARWYMRNKFQLMESFVGELDRDPIRRNPTYLRERFLRIVQHAQRVLVLRTVVTVLLAIGAIATLTSTILDQAYRIPILGQSAALQAFVEGTRGVFATTAAIAGSLTLVLVLARLAIDRYLELTAVSANYTAMQLANAR